MVAGLGEVMCELSDPTGPTRSCRDDLAQGLRNAPSSYERVSASTLSSLPMPQA
jgi:hypothetical protein